MKCPFSRQIARIAATTATVTICSSASADEPASEPRVVFLPGAAREISRSTSASRDAPVMELAYGPRAQASAGAEPGLLLLRGDAVTSRIGFYGLVALENGANADFVPPTETWRELLGASFALNLRHFAQAWLPRGSDFEIAFVVGHEGAHQNGDVTLPPLGPHDIPFGGGGNFIAPDVAWQMPVAHAVTITMRLSDRIYWNAVPLLFGARTASDVVADDLHEGLASAATADVIARWKATSWAQPELAIFGEHDFARDAFVSDAGFFRAVARVVFPGKIGELSPFVSFDAGNGKGLLIVRRESRLSVGARYAFF